MKLEPRKATDRGGWLCMPLVINGPEGKPGWKKVRCPECGTLCWQRPEEYIQLQAVKLDDDTYMVQEFDNELVFMGELWSGCKYPDEVLDWMKSNYEIESCLTAEVYRSSLGDCTNNGISSYARELYILDAQKGPFEPDDIRQCVYIEKREIMGQEYVDCKPAYCRKRWYMAGGNILYTSDSRFEQITGISYPIAIHDRYEGR